MRGDFGGRLIVSFAYGGRLAGKDLVLVLGRARLLRYTG